MDGVILKQLTVNKNYVEFKFEARGNLKDYFTTDTMFLEYQEDMSDIPKSILAIPFVASILPLMWLTDTVLWVEEIDKTFYDSVYKIKAAYQNLYNHYPLKGNFIPAKIIDNTYDVERQSLLLFSGGMDAHTTYIRHIETNPILTNIQGWYQTVDGVDKAADADFKDVSEFAKIENRDVEFVKSNFAVIVNSKWFDKRITKKLGDTWWHGFQHSMSFISIAIPLAYKFKVKNVYIASSVPIGEYVHCASYVTTDSEFRFASNGGCIHDGSELTRQDKAKVIVDHANSLKRPYPIRVCSFNEINCCKCDKCFRSVLGITAEGGDVREFGFDIKDSLKNHFEKEFEENMIKHRVEGEGNLHWPAIQKKMKENYSGFNDEQKEFVDWFLSYDFQGKRKKAILNYRFKNFFSIIIKRIKNRFMLRI
ncbi:MAG: hypothetical protein IJ731_04925 [Eubacterium sp.]|nr:hypothetical protein [Eubacterium sp.]